MFTISSNDDIAPRCCSSRARPTGQVLPAEERHHTIERIQDKEGDTETL